MTRKKSRPTHRENAAAAPSNEGGFYKMFWNSMDTNQGTNGPNSPSQVDVPEKSPPVIIVNDSPAGSPCEDEIVCDEIVVPVPIKEEIREVEKTQNSSSEPSSVDFQESPIERRINGECALPLPTCLPGNPLTSPSKISSTSPSHQNDLSSVENPPQTVVCANLTPVSEINQVIESEIGSSGEKPTIRDSSDELQDTPHAAEDGGSKVMGENQVCAPVSSEDDELIPETSDCQVDSGEGVVGEMSSNNHDSEPPDLMKNSTETPFGGTPQPSSPVGSLGVSELGIAPDGHIDGMSATTVTNEILGNVNQELPGEMDVPSTPPPPTHESPEEGGKDLYDARFAVVSENDFDASSEAIQPPQSPTSFQILNLLSCMLNADEEELENITRDLDLSGINNDECNEPTDSNMHNEGEGAEVNSEPDNTFPGNTEVSSMDIDQNVAGPENNDVNSVSDANQQADSNEMVVEVVGDKFPTLNNFLPKKIKIDTIGVMRSVRVLKDELRALYKEYLRDDVLLRTANAPPVEERPVSPEVEETPSFPPTRVYPICCVKMERLPDPFVKKSTIAMSDDTFKTWKRQITRQRNEEKFRNLKIWRRGRVMLWRECELAGMDRATYDEQVAYVNKHKVSETSSSGEDSSEDESDNDASSRHFLSSGESSEDELASLEGSSVDASTPKSVRSLPQIELNTSTVGSMLGDEYVVESSLSNQTSPVKAPSALKITIRKTSTSKSEEDKEKTTDNDGNFTVPTQPSYKPRKVATKRTFRRPDDPIKSRPKTTVPDLKKSKTLAEPEDLYDQSLLGTRRDEVENFNLLEKWDIPFEAPTLFRSPRVASKLAQLKTKEAFAPSFKKHAIKTTGASVSKEVKEVVEMLCSKTVEAMLFPDSKSTGSMKLAKTHDGCAVESKGSQAGNQLIEVPFKPGVPTDETNLNLDESSEMSFSETNSTIDASSDFGGSTASLVSDDLPPPKTKSPQKPRRRKRFGFWKKKKVRGKVPGEPPAVQVGHEGDEASVIEKTDNGNDGSKQKAVSSPAHSTQVPVVSEGPGQSPYESEDDATHKAKDQVNPSKLSPRVDVSTGRKPCEESKQLPAPTASVEATQTGKKAQQEAISPRLTRSKQPTIELDKDLLENFGSRKRKHSAKDPSIDSKKSRPDVPKSHQESPQALGDSPAFKGTDDDNSNTQVPEVSEGPGEVPLDSEVKRDHENKDGSQAPKGRMLRSRTRLSCPVLPNANEHPENSQNMKPTQTGNDKSTENNVLEAPLDLESPQSPPPENIEPEPLVNNRITRSKKRRSGPAYVAVKTAVSNELPSVCDIVDSIAGKRLPTPSKLFDTSANSPNQATAPFTSFNAASHFDDTPCIDEKGSEVEKQRRESGVHRESADEKLDQPPKEQKTTETPIISGDETREEVESARSDSLSKLPSNSSDLLSEHHEPAAVLCDLATGSSNLAVVPDASVSPGESSGPKDGKLELAEVTGVGSGRLEVLDTLNTILAVSSPKKGSVAASSPGSSPLLSVDLQALPRPSITQSSPSTVTVSNSILPSLPPAITPDITSLLPGTLLPSLPGTLLPDLRTTLDTDFVALSNDIEDSTIISPWADSPGDLVVDDDEEMNTNTTTLEALNDFIKDSALDAFSDDETNNTDLADKIDKIILDQMHQDTSPIPSLKPKASTGSKSNDKPDQEDGTSKADTEKSGKGLTRRDSIDERTGLPNTLIQRLRDPRIRSRLLSHLEEVETLPQATGPSVPGSQTNPSEVNSKLAGEQPIVPQEPQAVVPAVSADVPTPSQPESALMTTQTSGTQVVVTPCITPSTLASTQPVTLETPIQVPLVRPVTPLHPLIENVETPEEPPDPSKVDFLVPPSDDEEEESIKRRPKKAKKEIDVELMYKSPLEDLQSEARPAYGERAPRRYADNFPRRRSGDVRPRWDERRSRRDEPRSFDERDSRPSRDPSRDQRFDGPRGRDRSRDRRFYDRPPIEQSRDRRFDDRYARDEQEGPYPMDRPFNQSWPHEDPSPNHHRMINAPEPPHWQPNYYPELQAQPTPPIFVPEPPKIDYMETRLINLELLPKTTNLDIPPIKKVYSYFNKDNIQMLRTPPPTYDPNDQPRTIKMMDPTGEGMIDFVQLPRPTSGLTKEYFRHVPPDLSLDDVVKFHFISPAYVMVRDNEEDPISASDDEDDRDARHSDILQLHHMKHVKSMHEQNRKLASLPARQEDVEPLRSDVNVQVRVMQESNNVMSLGNDPLENILESLPLLKEQYSIAKSQLLKAPPPPEWNDVDLRVSDSPLKDSPKRPRSRSRSRSPYRRRPRRRRSRSPSLSDMSISESPSSRSSSPSRRRRSPRRRRSRSRSSERSRSRRSFSPRHSTSSSPSKRRSRR